MYTQGAQVYQSITKLVSSGFIYTSMNTTACIRAKHNPLGDLGREFPLA